MSELCCKFQILTSNTVGGDAETRTVPQFDMVQNMYVIQGDVILCNNDLKQNCVSFMHMANVYLNCVSSFKYLHQIL